MNLSTAIIALATLAAVGADNSHPDPPDPGSLAADGFPVFSMIAGYQPTTPVNYFASSLCLLLFWRSFFV